MRSRKNILVTRFLCVFLILCFIGYLIFANVRFSKENTDIAYFRNYNISDFHLMQDYNETLVLFPQNIESEMKVNDYSYLSVYREGSVVGANIYLSIKYSDEDYQKELEKLSSWSRKYIKDKEEFTLNFKYEESDLFNFPAYVASYNFRGIYEYALLIGENSIVYVYLINIREKEITVPMNYMPTKYFDIEDRILNGSLREKNEATNKDSFTVYYNL